MALRRLFLFLLYCFPSALLTAQSARLVLPIGHTKQVNFAQFSPDGKKLITVSDDKTAKLWDVATGSILADLFGHKTNIKSAQFSPDGLKVVTASEDGTARIWDAVTGNLLASLQLGLPVNSALFSPPSPADPTGGSRLLTASFDDTLRVWNVATGTVIMKLPGHKDYIWQAAYNKDGTKAVSAATDKTAIVWDMEKGTPLVKLTGHTDIIDNAEFSSDGKKIITTSLDYSCRVWNALTGEQLLEIKGPDAIITSAHFNPDGSRILSVMPGNKAVVWDAVTGKKLFEMKGHKGPVKSAEYSPDGKMIVTASEDGNAATWNASNGSLVDVLAAHLNIVNYAAFSNDSKKIVTASADKSAIIWNAATGKIMTDMLGLSSYVSSARFSKDGKTIVTTSYDYTLRQWDATSGRFMRDLSLPDVVFGVECSRDGKKMVVACGDSTAYVYNYNTGSKIFRLKGHRDVVRNAQFSPDGNKVVTASWDRTAKVWSGINGKLLLTLKHAKGVQSACFSPDGKNIVTASWDKLLRVWDATTGRLVRTLTSTGAGEVMFGAEYSPDGKTILGCGDGYSATLWPAAGGKPLRILDGHEDMVLTARFSPDGKRAITTSADNTAVVWDLATGAKLFVLKGHEGDVSNAAFSSDGKKIITSSSDNTCKIWDAQTGALYYTFLSVAKDDYLVVDPYNRYDGTPPARRKLYFIRQGEVVELSQVKDQLWVPELAERINKGETINAKKLDELDVFQQVPLVEEIPAGEDLYHFSIKPQRGGLGETIVYINGIEAFRYQPAQLTKTGEGYELVLRKADLAEFLAGDNANKVMVKAGTARNDIISRGAVVEVKDSARNSTPPNLYAVMIGVSDYKGEELDLKYASKDATDLSAVVSGAARKLLNTDSTEHVFMYNLTTQEGRYKMPEKKTVKEVLEDIGRKATANDILLIFFAGHGVMAGEDDKKQFYFLTADASTLSTTDAVKDVGISMAELTEWIQPRSVKAQKRILIFDACNSGQAIRDMVKIGTGEQQFVAARNDDKSRQVKAIDKLNEKSGLFILSASASNQNAYEMGRYSQGLLTYSLLKAIHDQPEVLDNGRFLDIGKWFDAAGKSVTDLAAETGGRQDPQIIANTNFMLGVVDQDLISRISLPQEKPVFNFCNLQNNDEAAGGDDLGLNKMVNQQLADLAEQAAGSNIVFIAASNAPDACTIGGRYTVSGKRISVHLCIRQQQQVVKWMDASGDADKPEELARQIAALVNEWAGNK